MKKILPVILLSAFFLMIYVNYLSRSALAGMIFVFLGILYVLFFRLPKVKNSPS